MKPFRITLLTLSSLVCTINLNSQDFYTLIQQSSFSSVDLFNPGTATLEDIDDDGDYDIFMGLDNNNLIHYFENVGSPEEAEFIELFDDANPLNSYINGSGCNMPVLVDIDNDADLDAIIGTWFSEIRFLRNLGTSQQDSFIQLWLADNPFDYITTEGVCGYPAFNDIDDDGDLDLFISDDQGNIDFHNNIGNKNIAAFEKDVLNNPLSEMNFNSRAKLVFHDVDKDGLEDLVIAHEGDISELFYYHNTGTVGAPVYEKQEGDANPFEGITSTVSITPIFRDVDNDGDKDLLLNEWGNIKLYQASQTNSVYEQLYEKLQISPNPALDFIMIKSEMFISSYELYTYSGVLIQKGKLGNRIQEISLNYIPAGFYIIKIYGNSAPVSKKIIIAN